MHGGFSLHWGSCARPSIAGGLGNQARSNGVRFDVVPNFVKLLPIAHEMIVAFFLPEGVSR